MNRVFEYFATLWKVTNEKGPGGDYIWGRSLVIFPWLMVIILIPAVIVTWFDKWVFFGLIAVTIVAYYIGCWVIKREKNLYSFKASS
ncbi:hypothetical protein A3K73_00320 [Candidatus Pacearchaeota archaeon RBG_13_36_9]|nr:MAG: hypothetical protein A3K73_00320 [Candidatus Pacearchaeota archaeon RBG_13_36_9]HJX50302.1 hypothetical protein [Candidatus Nanoarchaeia archaeon]